MTDVGAQTMQVEFFLPTQATLVEGWQNAVWDEALRHAHEAGHIPVGPILISDPEPWNGPEQAPLMPGIPMSVQNPFVGVVNVVKVTATLMLGV